MMRRVWAGIGRGMLVEAEAACRDALIENPSLLEAEFALAVIAYRRGQFQSAIDQVDRVLSRQPNLMAALTLAATISYESSRAEIALEYARRALNIRRSDPSILNLIGRCLLALRRPAEAVDAFEAQIYFAPNQANGHLGRAEAFFDIGSSFDGAESLASSIKLSPTSERLTQLAETEAFLGRPRLALSAARQALRHDPGSVRANVVAGRSLVELGRPEEAQSHWAAARSSSGGAWRVDRQEAYAHSMQGRFSDAESCLRRSIQSEPRQGRSYHLLFTGRIAGSEDRDLIDQMEALVSEEKLESEELTLLCYGLGKAWDDLGDPERSMSFYNRANELRLAARREHPFRQEALADQCAIQRELFSAPEPPQSRPAIGKPIFVLGMMRSGTSLVEQILSAHPSVTGAGELDFWTGSEAILVDPGRRTLKEERIPERVAAYLRLLGSYGQSGNRVIDKNPANVLIAGLLHRALPDAPIIYISRNPVDVALSIWTTDARAPFMACKSNIVFAIRQARFQAEHWRRILPANRFLDIHYEDLVADPEASIRSILAFCGLPWDDACLRAQSARTNVRTPSLWQVRQPVYTTSVARWKRFEPWLGEFQELLDDNHRQIGVATKS